MTKRVWEHFAEQFGHSNLVPIAQMREGVESDLPAGVVGKVPSVYNTAGKIVGFKDWQKCRATASLAARWSDDSRYGFGVVLGQPLPGGGVAVCVDVDTENADHQAAVYQAIKAVVGSPVPMRVRTNSARRAYVLCVETQDQITKRVLKLEKVGGKPEAVEFLAHGQQFAAFGVHPSGFDIEWLDAPADDYNADELLPNMGQGGQRMSLEAFNAVIDAIRHALPIITDTAKAGRNRSAVAHLGKPIKHDAVALFLDAEGWTLSIGGEGQRNIRSPFEHEYTNEQGDGDTSVTYFLPGTRDYEQGHFVSHHASDAGKSDAAFLDALGYVASQFPAYETSQNESRAYAPALERDKGGKIEPTLPNILAALKASAWLGYDVRFDAFAGELVIGGPGAWRSFRDTDYTWLRVALEAHGFKPVSKDMMRDAVHACAEVRTIDTAQEWLTGIKWDGVKRIDRFFPLYFGTPDDDYTRAASAYVWTALAGRVLKPGSKADMMPILIGPQGCGKSTGIAAISPDLRYFVELSFHTSDTELARLMRGTLVGELAEMAGLRKREQEAIKAMITRTSDKWRPLFQENVTQYDRRVMLFGSSNETELLDDATGARRFLPMECGTVAVDDIKHDNPQLWAEAAARFLKNGIEYAYAAKLAAPAHEIYRVVDPLEQKLEEWLDTADELDGSSPGARGVTTTDAIEAMKARGVRIDLDRSGQIKAGKALKALGYQRRRKLINNSLRWLYEKAAKLPT